MMPKVAVRDAARYDAALIAGKLAEALVATGHALPLGAQVLVKPSLLAQNYPAQSRSEGRGTRSRSMRSGGFSGYRAARAV